MENEYFTVKNIGDLLEDIFDIRKTEKPCGLKVGKEYLITREQEKDKIYTRLWTKKEEKNWEEEVKVWNPYFIAVAILEYARDYGATYYRITDDRFTKMEGR